MTHGHNWAKMRNKEKRPHAKDGTERGQKGPRPAGLGPSEPAGLAHSGAESVSVFFSTKIIEGIIQRVSRDEFQRAIRVRHKRKATPEASSSLGAAASWRTTRDHPLPEISSP